MRSMDLEKLKTVTPGNRVVDMSSPEFLHAYRNGSVRRILFQLALVSFLGGTGLFWRTKSAGGSLGLLAMSLLGAYGVSFALTFRFVPTNRGVFLRDAEPVRYWLFVGIPVLALVAPFIFFFAAKK